MDDRAWTRTIWVGWFVALGILVLAAWGDPQSRTQEARVLLGGREMLGKSIDGWLIPTANGETRLNKPPLAYWTSAASYSVFGTSVLAGRLPAVLASWLTLGLVYAIGRRLFGGFAGLYAAGTLMGSWLFFRFAPLAETDVLVMLFVTAAAYAIVRARGTRERAWLIVVGACIGLILMTKGPAAGYVLLMMLALDVVDGCFTRGAWRTSLLIRYITSGAVGVSVVIGVPWFVYAMNHPEAGEMTNDLANSARGGKGHAEPWWTYGPELLIAALPWTFIWMIAGIASLKVLLKWTADLSDRYGLILLYAWGGAVIVPLMLWGNKQPHYLLAMLPAMMLTTGWAIDRAVSMKWPSMRPAVEAVLTGMLIAGLLGAAGVIGTAWKVRPAIATIDLLAAAAVALTFLVAIAVAFKVSALRAVAVVTAVVVALAVVKPVWAPSLEPPGTRELADELNRRFPDATFVFRGTPSLPLCVAMKRVIPSMTDEQLAQLARSTDGTRKVVCLYEAEKEPPPLLHYRMVLRLEAGEQDLIAAAPDRDLMLRQ